MDIFKPGLPSAKLSGMPICRSMWTHLFRYHSFEYQAYRASGDQYTVNMLRFCLNSEFSCFVNRVNLAHSQIPVKDYRTDELQ